MDYVIIWQEWVYSIMAWDGVRWTLSYNQKATRYLLQEVKGIPFLPDHFEKSLRTSNSLELQGI
jgi:hypothetical protein